MWWPLTLTDIFKVIRPWPWKSFPLCSVNTSGWILSIFGTNDHYHEKVCCMWWSLTLTYIFKVIRPWLWKCPLCSLFSCTSIISIFATNNHYHERMCRGSGGYPRRWHRLIYLVYSISKVGWKMKFTVNSAMLSVISSDKWNLSHAIYHLEMKYTLEVKNWSIKWLFIVFPHKPDSFGLNTLCLIDVTWRHRTESTLV